MEFLNLQFGKEKIYFKFIKTQDKIILEIYDEENKLIAKSNINY